MQTPLSPTSSARSLRAAGLGSGVPARRRSAAAAARPAHVPCEPDGSCTRGADSIRQWRAAREPNLLDLRYIHVLGLLCDCVEPPFYHRRHKRATARRGLAACAARILRAHSSRPFADLPVRAGSRARARAHPEPDPDREAGLGLSGVTERPALRRLGAQPAARQADEKNCKY